jgi:oxygen-independent coproporphyrinogen-3 oxidase
MTRPLESLYVHVPFCAAKCDYCAFYSVPDADEALRRAYLRRLENDLTAAAHLCSPLESVYFGGGTPSVLSAEEMGALLSSVRRQVELQSGAEVTVECNPDSLTPDKVDVLAAHGVNRISLGIQSFLPRLRGVLGRRGTLDGLDSKLRALRDAGIRNLGMDLIHAIPGQSLDDWRCDLRSALATGVRHLSAYELTVEEGSRLGAAEMAEVSEDLVVDMWHAASEEAAAAGLERYEVSNLARPGSECLHNRQVWHGGTYLGCGPAACSFDGEVRRANPPDLARWLGGEPPEEDRLPPPQRAAEVLGFGLRTVEGWTAREFRERTGRGYLNLAGDTLTELAGEGLLALADDAVRPTTRGLLFADMIARRLLC